MHLICPDSAYTLLGDRHAEVQKRRGVLRRAEQTFWNLKRFETILHKWRILGGTEWSETHQLLSSSSWEHNWSPLSCLPPGWAWSQAWVQAAELGQKWCMPPQGLACKYKVFSSEECWWNRNDHVHPANPIAAQHTHLSSQTDNPKRPMNITHRPPPNH